MEKDTECRHDDGNRSRHDLSMGDEPRGGRPYFAFALAWAESGFSLVALRCYGDKVLIRRTSKTPPAVEPGCATNLKVRIPLGAWSTSVDGIA
jgi:hypothetical protein